jgi:peptidoglycan/LPS O-acetylase OafA/YrhL
MHGDDKRMIDSGNLRHVDSNAIHAAVSSPRIAGLDFLRAVAVLLVIVGHTLETWSHSVGGLGRVGVTLFFVLSGFLITLLALQEYARFGQVDMAAFYRRRVARLLPAFYLFLVMGISVLWLHHRPIPWAAILASMFYYINYYQAFTGAATNLVSHCWSLAVEEQFYLLWPMCFVLLLRWKSGLVRALAGVILGVWCWRWYLVGVVDASADYLYRALDTRADSLAVGCLLAVMVTSPDWRGRLGAIIRAPALGLLLIVALFAVVLCAPPEVGFKYGFAFVIEPPMIALLLLMTMLVARQSGWLAMMINNRLIVHIGQISYGMYLFQGLIGYTPERFVYRHTGNLLVSLIAECTLIIVFCSASFRWIESPLRRLIVGNTGTRHAATVAAGTV